MLKYYQSTGTACVTILQRVIVLRPKFSIAQLFQLSSLFPICAPPRPGRLFPSSNCASVTAPVSNAPGALTAGSLVDLKESARHKVLPDRLSAASSANRTVRALRSPSVLLQSFAAADAACGRCVSLASTAPQASVSLKLMPVKAWCSTSFWKYCQSIGQAHATVLLVLLDNDVVPQLEIIS